MTPTKKSHGKPQVFNPDSLIIIAQNYGLTRLICSRRVAESAESDMERRVASCYEIVTCSCGKNGRLAFLRALRASARACFFLFGLVITASMTESLLAAAHDFNKEIAWQPKRFKPHSLILNWTKLLFDSFARHLYGNVRNPFTTPLCLRRSG
jgi:hypothetical protein